MAKGKSAGPSSNRSHKKEESWSFSDESIADLSNEFLDSTQLVDKIISASESLKEMSEDEIAQHLNFCMKLSAENVMIP